MKGMQHGPTSDKREMTATGDQETGHQGYEKKPGKNVADGAKAEVANEEEKTAGRSALR